MVKVDGARLYHRVVQGEIIITRPAPILRLLQPPFSALRARHHSPLSGRKNVAHSVMGYDLLSVTWRGETL